MLIIVGGWRLKKNDGQFAPPAHTPPELPPVFSNVCCISLKGRSIISERSVLFGILIKSIRNLLRLFLDKDVMIQA